MNLYEYQNSSLFIDLDPRSLRFNFFIFFLFLETAWPIEAKFYVKPPWDRGTEVYSTGPSQMTKMATMPIHGKNLKKSSPEPEGRWPWNLVCSMVLEYYQVCSHDDTGLTLTYFTAMSYLVPYAFVWEKG